MEAVRKLGTVTQWAVEGRSDSPGDHPRSESKRWLVTNMLIVATREFGDPIALHIAVETGNRSLHVPTVLAWLDLTTLASPEWCSSRSPPP
jgi:hypothetical protein